jgi:hypothetical protein
MLDQALNAMFLFFSNGLGLAGAISYRSCCPLFFYTRVVRARHCTAAGRRSDVQRLWESDSL